jgi:protein-tyrosine kinase
MFEDKDTTVKLQSLNGTGSLWRSLVGEFPEETDVKSEQQEKQKANGSAIVATPLPALLPAALPQKKGRDVSLPRIKKEELINVRLFQERCQQLCLSLFFQENATLRSMGFISAIGGEGKSLLSMVTAQALASDSGNPVILLECNWEHPDLASRYELADAPGLAEWLRHECNEDEIRHAVAPNLTVIPAGNSKQDAVRLIQQMRSHNVLQTLAPSNEYLIVDLPAIVTTAYGPLAASLVDALILVVRAGVTPDSFVQEACIQLKDQPVQGIILNQLASNVPGWLRKLL